MAADLKKLRAKNIVQRIGQTRRYESTASGLRAMVALVVLRNKAIKPNGAKISIAFVEDGGELHAFYDGVLSGMDKPWGGVSWLLARNG